MSNEFTCEHCGGTFERAWSEADAIMEYQELWTEEQRAEPEMPVSVCDDCFQILMAKARELGLCEQ